MLFSIHPNSILIVFSPTLPSSSSIIVKLLLFLEILISLFSFLVYVYSSRLVFPGNRLSAGDLQARGSLGALYGTALERK